MYKQVTRQSSIMGVQLHFISTSWSFTDIKRLPPWLNRIADLGLHKLELFSKRLATCMVSKIQTKFSQAKSSRQERSLETQKNRLGQ